MPQSDSESQELELLQRGYRYAVSLTHHHADAEDLTQQAWVNLCRLHGRVTSRAALFTTIRHLFIDRCRRDRVIVFDSLEESTAEPSIDSVDAGVQGDLNQLLGALRPGEREVIYLHHVDGHTAEEVGILTSQPRGTVLSLLSRAMKKLRKAADPRG